MNHERSTHSICKAGDFIFVCGGIGAKDEPLNSCEKFSLDCERWIKISNMIVAKSHLSLCNVNNQFLYSIGGENRYESLLDLIEKYTINLDTWEVINVRLPIKIECTGCVQISHNEILILGGYSSEHGSLKNIYIYDTLNNSVRKTQNELSQAGWSIYQPIKIANNIHLFYGGEEDFPPHHVTYSL